jgi:hypothetical protein
MRALQSCEHKVHRPPSASKSKPPLELLHTGLDGSLAGPITQRRPVPGNVIRRLQQAQHRASPGEEKRKAKNMVQTSIDVITLLEKQCGHLLKAIQTSVRA